jgi:hypothetical protein
MVNAPHIREWLGTTPLITWVAIGTGAACLRRLLWRSKVAPGSLASNVSISLVCGGGSTVIALFCGAPADIVAMLAGLTIVFIVDNIVSKLLQRRPAAP